MHNIIEIRNLGIKLSVFIIIITTTIINYFGKDMIKLMSVGTTKRGHVYK